MSNNQGSFPAGMHGHGITNLIFVAGTQCPYFLHRVRANVGTHIPVHCQNSISCLQVQTSVL